MKKLPALQSDTEMRMYVRIESSVGVRIDVRGVWFDLCFDNSLANYAEVLEPGGIFIKWL